MAITSARLARLEKQQEFLRKRGREMLKRGLQTLDELDAMEEKEQQEAAKKHDEPVATSAALPEFDPFGGLSPSFWETWGGDVGTPLTTLGS